MKPDSFAPKAQAERPTSEPGVCPEADPSPQPPQKHHKPRFRAHVGHYAWAEMVVAGLGLLSFPILTRLLTVADYGTMNLVASALGIAVALGKAGMQHAVIRGWAEVDAGHSVHSPAVFEATAVWGMAALGGLVTLIWAIAAGVFPEAWWGGPGIGPIFLLAAPLVLLRVLDAAMFNLLRAREMSAALAVYSSLRRAGQFVLVVGVLWGLSRDLKGFFLATLMAEALALVVLVSWMYRVRPVPRPAQLSSPLWVSLMAFGLPLLGSELATVVLTMSDRFLIQSLLGAQSVGIYAATYNVCDHVRSVLLGALVGAAYPRCIILWETQGRDGLQRFLVSLMHTYASVAIFGVALIAAVGGDLLIVLASKKYAEGGPLAGWIMAGLAVQTLGAIAAVGLAIAKRTLLAMTLLLLGGLFSIGTNLVLIPWFGLQGAGWAVFATSVLVCMLQIAFARRYAPVVMPWRTLGILGAAACLAAMAASQIVLPNDLVRLSVRTLILVLLYGAAVLAYDRHARAWLVSRWSRFATR
jgi:O-antigen/teichoic acid export membrane protein